MRELAVDIETADGAMNTFVAHPDEGTERPVILFLMDAPGMRSELHQMVRRLAATGYYVIASNLYYRRARQYNVFETQDSDVMFEHMASLSNAMVVKDCEAMLNWAADQDGADVSQVGAVGYCMSGPFALMAAAKIDSVKAGASIHGVRLAADAEDSPHNNLSDIGAEVYVACAETDAYAPTEMVEEYTSALAASTTKGQVEWYPGTHHGFAFPERPQYDAEASLQHWERLSDLFRRTLPYEIS